MATETTPGEVLHQVFEKTANSNVNELGTLEYEKSVSVIYDAEESILPRRGRIRRCFRRTIHFFCSRPFLYFVLFCTFLCFFVLLVLWYLLNS